MSAAPHPFALAEAWLRDHRHQLATKLEEAMSHLSDLIANGKRLAAERVALIADRDSERSRAEAAEKHAADLQSKIDADDKAAADAAADLDAEIAKEAGVTVDALKAAPADGMTKTPVPGDTLSEGQGPAPVVTTSPSGATITVSATETTHVDPVAQITTTVPHDGGAPTAVDATGAAVQPEPAVVAEAEAAKAAVGAPIPSA